MSNWNSSSLLTYLAVLTDVDLFDREVDVREDGIRHGLSLGKAIHR
jgi:hypothetical protein